MTGASDASVTELDVDPFDDAALRDPYGMQRQLRDAGPVVWLTRYECYAVARYASVDKVIREHSQFSSAAGVGLAHLRRPGAWREPSPIVEVDPPRHTAIRAVLNRIVAPSVIRGWREAFVEQARRLVDRLLDQRDCEGVDDIAQAYVSTVFPAALGVESHPRNFRIVGHHSANAAGPRNALFEASQAELESIMDWYQWSQSPAALVRGGFGERVFAAEAAGEVPAGTASPLMRTLVRGGLDTTISGIATTLWLLARHPGQWARVRADPALVVPAFEEAIRLESPTCSIFRTTTEMADIEGIRLAPDTKIQMCIGAANRDPRQWPDAERFDVTRRARQTLAFGGGAHNCLGQRIARLEVECLVTEIVARAARIELSGEPRWAAINALRTLESLPLRLTAA